MKKSMLLLFALATAFSAVLAQADSTIKKKDRRRDVLLQTSMGDISIRLSDSTPLHRDNFLKLVKVHYYDGILFHRVIKDFMIQAGDPNSKTAKPGEGLGGGDLGYTVPAEIQPGLFHRKGVIAAARMGDNVNPQRASSSCQFYLVQGKKFTDADLDNIERTRLKGKKIPAEQREVYKTIGGTPHLDQAYTVYGEIVAGLDVVDRIAGVETSKIAADIDRPLQDVKIVTAKLVKRKKKK